MTGQLFIRSLTQSLSRSRSIRQRLFWLLLGCASGAIVLVNLIWLPSTIHEIKQSQLDLQSVAARAVHDRVEQHLSDIEQDLKRAELQFQVSLLSDDRDGLTTAAQRLMQQQTAFEEVGILEPDGKVSFRLSRRLTATTDRGVDPATSQLFHASKKGVTSWSAVRISEVSEPSIVLSKLMGSSGGDRHRMVYGVINLKWLWRLADQFVLSREGRVSVVDGAGRLIAGADPSSVLKQVSLADRSFIKNLSGTLSADKDRLSHGDYRNENGVEVAATAMALTSPEWTIIVSQPQALLYASIREKVWFFIALTLLGIAISILLARSLSRSFTTPISRLRQGAEQIADGQFDHRVPAESEDEIGQLAHQFNRMAEALKFSHQGLEDKIAARTRELTGFYTALTPLSGANTIDDILSGIIDRVMTVTGADAAQIRVYDAAKVSFISLAHKGFSESYLEATRVPSNGNANALVLARGEPVIASNIATDARIKAKRQLDDGFHSCAFLPLAVKGEVRGVIQLSSRMLGYFNEDKGESLMAIARLMGIVVENHDLLQSSRRAADELLRSNAELEQFAYVASHDLQEPLRMITSYSQLIAKRYADRLGDDAREYIHFMVDGAKRMQGLINDLLTYSRVGTKGKAFEAADFSEIVQTTLATLHLAIADSGAKVTFEGLPTANCDRGQINQLFQNLIGNAIKYRNGKAPEVHLSCRQEGNDWRFSVRDNGIGIDPQYAEQVFVIFQRLHTRDEYEGTGIGLAVCKKIVERHRGKIWVESEPGQGSTFHFTLPA